MGVFLGANRLFLSDGEGRFIDATNAEIAHQGQAFNAVTGDVDGNGLPDILQAAGGGFDSENNFEEENSLLLLNLGKGAFADVVSASGLERLTQVSLLSVGLADLDNDGDLDLVAGDAESNPLAFANQGNGSFVDVTLDSGLEFGGWNTAFCDFDLDGSVDLWFGGLGGGLLRNRGTSNHWLRLELVGTESNRSAIGARIIAVTAGKRQVREILGGNGYNQDEMVAHFGLGEQTVLDRLEVHWPSGQVTELGNIAADQRIRVFEGESRFHPVQADDWHHDLPKLLTSGERREFSLTVRPGLFHAGASVTSVVADLGSLGGQRRERLIAEADGSFRFSGRLAAEEPGHFRVEVWIDQDSPHGPRWSRLSHKIVVLPAPKQARDLVLFGLGDEESPEAVNFFGDAPAPITDPDDSEHTVLATISDPTFIFAWFLPEAVPSQDYSVLQFNFHPGDALTPAQTGVPGRPGAPLRTEDGEILVSIDGPNGSFVGGAIEVDLSHRGWQRFEWPIPQQAAIALDGISALFISGDFGGTVYVDDVRLVAVTPPLTAVTEALVGRPAQHDLGQNYPNPFNSGTVIDYTIPHEERVDLRIFNSLGQEVATLVDGVRPAGTHRLHWDGRDAMARPLATGVYFYRIDTEGYRVTRRLTLLR